MIFPSRELFKLPQGDITTKLTTANLRHTSTGGYGLQQNQEIVTHV